MSHTCATSRMKVARVAGNQSSAHVQVQKLKETSQVQVHVDFQIQVQDGCSSFRKPRRTDSKSNYLSSWQTQNHMYVKDSMYAMQCLFRRFYQKKMSTFLTRRLSFWISLWFHVPLEVAVALSSDRWPLRKAKKQARTSRMAWSSMEAAGRKFQMEVCKNVKHGQQWVWEQQFCSHKKCTTIALLSIYWGEQPTICVWILYNHSNSSSVLPLLVTGDFWQLGSVVLIQRK